MIVVVTSTLDTVTLEEDLFRLLNIRSANRLLHLLQTIVPLCPVGFDSSVVVSAHFEHLYVAIPFFSQVAVSETRIE